MTPSIAIDAASVRELSLPADVSRRPVMDRRLVDPGSQAKRIQAPCAGLDSEPTGQGAELRAVPIGLMDELGRLEAAIRKSRADAADRLREISTLRRAVSAYGRRPSDDKTVERATERPGAPR